MALPFLLPMLLTGGSMLANSIGAGQAAKAQASQMAAERQRQQALDNESYALNNVGRDRYAGFEGQQDERKTELTDMFTQALDTAPARPAAVLPQSSSNLVVANDAQEAGAARADAEDNAQRRGALQSFGDLFGDISRLQGRDAGVQGMLGGFKRGSQGVLPLELEAAAQKGSGWMMLGDLLNMGAGLTMPGALAAPNRWWLGNAGMNPMRGGLGGLF